MAASARCQLHEKEVSSRNTFTLVCLHLLIEAFCYSVRERDARVKLLDRCQRMVDIILEDAMLYHVLRRGKQFFRPLRIPSYHE